MSSCNEGSCLESSNNNSEKELILIEGTDVRNENHKGENEFAKSTKENFKELSLNTDTNETVDKNIKANLEKNKNKKKLKKSEAEIEKEIQQHKRQKRKEARKKKMKSQPREKVDLKKGHENYFLKNLPEKKKNSFDLPGEVLAMPFFQQTSKEAAKMLKAVKSYGGNKTPLQILPRNMRRRAASHNIKRLPKSLQPLALQNQDSKNEVEVSRKKRRRHQDLQNEYAKRTERSGWLETHLWHSKRFKMTLNNDEKYKFWNYLIPLHSNEKSFRSCNRELSSGCIMQDISYMDCSKLYGSELKLNQLLRLMTNSSDDLLLGIEVQRLVYSAGKCIGPVLFSKFEGKNKESIIVMIWTHPTITKAIVNLVKSLINNEKEVLFSDEKLQLNRFRITGPKSSVNLLSLLHEYPFSKDELKFDCSNTNDETTIKDRSIYMLDWILNNKDDVEIQNKTARYHLAETHRKLYSREKTNKLKLHGGKIYPIIVNDPRLKMPLQKTQLSFNDIEGLISHDEYESISKEKFLNYSPLLLKENIEKIKESRLPDHMVSTRKNQAKLNGEDKTKWINSIKTPVPIIVVARQGFVNTNDHTSTHSGPKTGFGSGYDVIIPQKWATAFWIPMIYNKIKPGGDRDLKRVSIECLKPHFPEDYPDTEAGKFHWSHIQTENLNQYYKRPPSKRPNYSVLGVKSPFAPDWNELCDEMSVLRNPSEIENIIRLLGEKSPEELNILASKQQENFIQVEVIMLSSGVTCEGAMLSIPTSDDISKLKVDINDLNTRGVYDCVGPSEPAHDDPEREKRKSDTALRKKNRKRKRENKESIPLIRTSHFKVEPFRKTIGFLTSGSYSHTFAKSVGIGLIKIKELTELFEIKCSNYAWLNELLVKKLKVSKSHLICLMRIPTSEKYRYVLIRPC